jgi:hypothetical protein
MEFISHFWPAYVPVGIVLVAAAIEWAADAQKGRTPLRSPNQFERAPSLHEARRCRSMRPAKAGRGPARA